MLNRARKNGIRIDGYQIPNYDIIEGLISSSIVPVHIGSVVDDAYLAACRLEKTDPEFSLTKFCIDDIHLPFINTWFEFKFDAIGINVAAIAFSYTNNPNVMSIDATGKYGAAIMIIVEPAFAEHIMKDRIVEFIGEWVFRTDSSFGSEKVLYESVIPSNTESYNDIAYFFSAACWTIKFACDVIACHNVELIESQPSMRSNKQQKDPSRIIHRTIKIHKPSVSSKDSERLDDDEERGHRAFHVRRGHFADYTKGNGLFGKYKVKFWVPSFTVGDKDYGTVIKNYETE